MPPEAIDAAIDHAAADLHAAIGLPINRGTVEDIITSAVHAAAPAIRADERTQLSASGIMPGERIAIARARELTSRSQAVGVTIAAVLVAAIDRLAAESQRFMPEE